MTTGASDALKTRVHFRKLKKNQIFVYMLGTPKWAPSSRASSSDEKNEYVKHPYIYKHIKRGEILVFTRFFVDIHICI